MSDIISIHTDSLELAIRCALCKNSWATNKGCDGCCVVNEYDVKNVTDAIMELKIERWIPCSERMPEDGEFVLAYSKQNTYKYEGQHISIQYFCNQYWWKEVFTYWMPLPEPPKEEE